MLIVQSLDEILNVPERTKVKGRKEKEGVIERGKG